MKLIKDLENVHKGLKGLNGIQPLTCSSGSSRAATERKFSAPDYITLQLDVSKQLKEKENVNSVLNWLPEYTQIHSAEDQNLLNNYKKLKSHMEHTVKSAQSIKNHNNWSTLLFGFIDPLGNFITKLSNHYINSKTDLINNSSVVNKKSNTTALSKVIF